MQEIDVLSADKLQHIDCLKDHFTVMESNCLNLLSAHSLQI